MSVDVLPVSANVHMSSLYRLQQYSRLASFNSILTLVIMATTMCGSKSLLDSKFKVYLKGQILLFATCATTSNRNPVIAMLNDHSNSIANPT